MKKTLPANAKISKEAKETVQECVSEFISFVTGEASDKCQREKRKTVNGDDLLWAMTTLGFDDYVVPLKDYLSSYRESDGETREKSEKNERVFRSSASVLTPCEVDFDAEKIASNPSFLQGLGSGGGVLVEFGGGRARAEGGGLVVLSGERLTLR
ncbi:nuclear transcription factor Y subunit B-3-like [Salvia hispanica]|uniref:nuclear transcription factor Y subunit B-3-like n=1 Tax=Salvia hispanica TaxID=49212 RepID=UPI0020098C64|nr:nuclear transcription factor Y subunit B-3-like [Salvia hispanica]